MDAELTRRLRWARNRVDLPAGRYDTILPPTAVSDLMIYSYWRSSALDAHDGQSVFSRRGGGTRIGERLSDKPLQVYSDPAEARLAAMPFVAAAASNEIESVFDNGLPLGRTDWVRDGMLAALLQTRSLRGADRAARHAVHRQPGGLGRRRHRQHAGPRRRRRARACC